MSQFDSQAARFRRFLPPLPSDARRRSFRAYLARMRAIGAPPSPRKIDLIEEAICQSAGASLSELIALTGWQAHSIRGAISRNLRKRRAMEIVSSTENGERRYRRQGRVPADADCSQHDMRDILG